MVFVNLACAVQNYDWGIKGRSEVSALGALNTGVPSDASKPYACLLYTSDAADE